MSDVARRTNGDYLQPVVDTCKKGLDRAVTWAREHPDELVIGVTPWILLSLATRRHRLNYAEAVIVTEVGYWCGVAAVERYQNWKSRPASGPSLKRVV